MTNVSIHNTYDNKKRLITLMEIISNLKGEALDSNVTIFSYNGNIVITTGPNPGDKTEYRYENSKHIRLLEEIVYSSGSIFSKTYYKYKGNKISSELLEKGGSFYHKVIYNYNENGSLINETYKAWDGFKDSTIHYYLKDGSPFLSKVWHLRKGDDSGPLRDWYDIARYGKGNKWIARYSYYANGKAFEVTKRTLDSNGLPLLMHQIRLDDKVTTTTIYNYEHYNN